MQEEIRKLFEWEAEARRIVEDASSQAQALREEANRWRAERLTQAAQKAKEQAEQTTVRILQQTERECRVRLTQAEEQTQQIRTESMPKMDTAVQTALVWLLGGEGKDVGGS